VASFEKLPVGPPVRFIWAESTFGSEPIRECIPSYGVKFNRLTAYYTLFTQGETTIWGAKAGEFVRHVSPIAGATTVHAIGIKFH
jgi:hypothetical protein